MDKGKRTSFKIEDAKPFGFQEYGLEFGILIDPENYFSYLPSEEELRSIEFIKRKLSNDFEADKEEDLYHYFKRLNLESLNNLQGKGEDGFQFLMTSCTQWDKFSALVVYGTFLTGSFYHLNLADKKEIRKSERVKKAKLERLVKIMEREHPSEKKNFYL